MKCSCNSHDNIKLQMKKELIEEKLIPYQYLKLFHKIRAEGTLLNYVFKTTVTLLQNHTKAQQIKRSAEKFPVAKYLFNYEKKFCICLNI